MNISQLLEALKDTSTTISVGEKLVAGISVTLLSMTVVIIVLTLISVLISLLQREKQKPIQKNTNEIINNTVVEDVNNEEDDMELVSVITAAIAQATGRSSDSLIVRKISRNNNLQTSWQTMAKNITK